VTTIALDVLVGAAAPLWRPAAPRPAPAGAPRAGAPRLTGAAPRARGGLAGTGARNLPADAAVGLERRERSGAFLGDVGDGPGPGCTLAERASDAAVGANSREDTAPGVRARAGVDADGVFGRDGDATESRAPVEGLPDGVLAREGVFGREVAGVALGVGGARVGGAFVVGAADRDGVLIFGGADWRGAAAALTFATGVAGVGTGVPRAAIGVSAPFVPTGGLPFVGGGALSSTTIGGDCSASGSSLTGAGGEVKLMLLRKVADGGLVDPGVTRPSELVWTGGHSRPALESSLDESPVVCETTLPGREGVPLDGGCFFVCSSKRPMRFATD
jgi:hypothetical protein